MKLEIKPIMAYNLGDVMNYLYHKKYDSIYEGGGDKEHMNFWNKCSSLVGDEIMAIAYKKPDQIEIEDSSEIIFKVIVSKLVEKGSILEFTKAYNITEDYLLLFTD